MKAKNIDLAAENKSLKRALATSQALNDNWREKYSRLEEQAKQWQREARELKRKLENERIMTDAIFAKFGVSTSLIREDFAQVNRAGQEQSKGCKVISMNING